MSGEFIAALDLETCKTTLSRDRRTYNYVCGLSVGISVDMVAPSASILQAPRLLNAAHQRHHAHARKSASLYMIGGQTPGGVETLSAVQCSDEWEREHPNV